MNARDLLELALACTCHAIARLVLRVLPFKHFLLLARVRLPETTRPLPLVRVQRLVSRSRAVCRGTCLTESVVMSLLARRHGYRSAHLTIGVERDGQALRAHAWAIGDRPGFTPLLRQQPDAPGKTWRD